MHQGADSSMRLLLRYAPMVYGPTALYSLGAGAIMPVLPALATDLGADLAGAALAAAALVVGQVAGNLPAGAMVSRFGERMTMLIASAASLAGVVLLAMAPAFWMLLLAAMFIGACSSAFGVARHAFMTIRVPYHLRARSLALVGGSFRLGGFTGPLIAAALLGVFGDERSVVWFFGCCLVLVSALVAFGPDPETVIPAERVPGPEDRAGVFVTSWRHRDVLAHLGLAAASLAGVRSSRAALLPVWGISIGLDTQLLALTIGLAGAVDFSLFYASGQIMDRFGRLWAAVPAMLLMGGGFATLAFVHDVDHAMVWFAACCALIAVGNGLSSGILLTLGADVAPRNNPAPFLGAWRMLTDAGGAAAPIAVAAITAAASVSVASGLIGAVGLAGAALFWAWVPKYAPRRDR